MPAAFYDYEDQKNRADDIGVVAALRALIPFLDRHRRRLLVSLALLVGGTAGSLAWPWLVQRAIDGPLTGQLALPAEARSFRAVLMFGAVILAIQAATLAFKYYQRVILEVIGQDVMLDLRRKIFAHILSLPVSFFDAHPVGRLMARVESDTEALRLLFTNAVVLVVGDLLLMAGLWGVMLYVNARLALAVIAVLPVLVIVLYTFNRITVPRFLEVRRKMAEVTATLTEYLHGMSIVQIFHRGEYVRRRLREVNRSKFDEEKIVEIGFCVLFNILFLLEHVKIALILLLGSLWGVPPGVIVLFILLVWQEFEPIARTADQLSSFQKGIAGARRIFTIMGRKSTLDDPKVPRPWRGVRRAIRFENVWFSYSDDENWVLKDVSFEIPAGSRIALAGVTGGGKSTIISLLLRMYDPQRGRITVDGADIREFTRDELRSRFALVLQDIILFPGDVESNISLESERVSAERVRLAAETVDADRFIRALPAGYATEVSEKGANFSRGERQLLSFARALAVDPEVLVLDEATGSVDPETERAIQGAIGRLMEGRTSLVIAHRLSTILDVDRIVVIRHGEIVEEGTHRELIVAGGYYAKLARLQFNGAREDLRDAV